MTTVDLTTTRALPVRTVDVAGTDWPLYKIESLVLALLVFAALALTVTMQTAVLTSAAVGVTLWWALGATERFRTRR
ncbi:hypothetical protein ASG56_17330 [Rhodococcus sp. Leaf7]|uniref:hypothetical protein n=1 Tax=unclassified Rhodococcus (in: high G+C Gram-positive bacteria) TaxID=192944 RepID=UPI0006F2C794|nr:MULTISPECIES: hypothetical protein [unclassified Rhodococcus (in: high G+C Gram-positive bacteria)]KQU02671.1 hypothetical protein ASG56_17330 [Rhodococcus sp. Leaf7]KQU38143.1 hypothetical protein ASG64_20060 [Rhodococcus sp. Leaf247]